MVRFWLNCSKARSIHWINKEQLLKEKSHEGIVFRYVDCLNDAMLMKQLCMVLSMPNLFLSKVMSLTYFRNGVMFSEKLKQADSFV